MRMIAVVFLAGVLGFALAGAAAATIVSTNAPDRLVEQRVAQMQSEQVAEPSVVQYGQR